MKKGFMIAFIAAILTACLLPIGANIFGYTAVNRENRPLAREPQIVDRDGLNLEFPSDFEGGACDSVPRGHTCHI